MVFNKKAWSKAQARLQYSINCLGSAENLIKQSKNYVIKKAAKLIGKSAAEGYAAGLEEYKNEVLALKEKIRQKKEAVNKMNELENSKKRAAKKDAAKAKELEAQQSMNKKSIWDELLRLHNDFNELLQKNNVLGRVLRSWSPAIEAASKKTGLASVRFYNRIISKVKNQEIFRKVAEANHQLAEAISELKKI